MFSLATETTSWCSIHLKVHPKVAFAGSLYLDCIDCGVTSLDFCFGFWGGTDLWYFQQTKTVAFLLGWILDPFTIPHFLWIYIIIPIVDYIPVHFYACRLSLSLCFKFFVPKKNIWRVSMCMKENGWPSASRSKVAMEGLISSSADGHRW